jgi:isoleucyl-tRNA synthetase
MASSENLMQRCAELYKKLRNTFRFLLGNLNGFDPASDAVAEADLLPLDRYMLARTRDLVEKIVGPDGKGGWYAAFEFHRIYHAVNEFAIVDLSAFYLDVLKDRMYTFAPTNSARRSAQTVLWKITDALVRLVAPILTFTADEIWEHLPKVEGCPESVHLAQFPKPEEIFAEDPSPLLEEWKTLFKVREGVLQHLETSRQAKIIGKALEADVEIWASDRSLNSLRRLKASDLKEFFNVSRVTVLDGIEFESDEPESFSLRTKVLPASGSKCARCWNFMPHVSNYGIWENVCDRCQNALREMNIAPPASDAAEAEGPK